ncbi:MAG: glycosyltransferase 87 family protein, partial [Candidatus Limnocylindrales bacterium]
MLDVTLIGAALLLSLVGIFVFIFHLVTDPLTDVHAYYEAGQRLNAGLPLYAGQTGADSADFYRYPPLLAIVFRPLALLPFKAAALIWEAGIVVALGLTVRRLGLRKRSTWLALGALAGPIAWAVTIGQAQVWVTLFLTWGNPASVALAGQLKLFPALIGLY